MVMVVPKRRKKEARIVQIALVEEKPRDSEERIVQMAVL